jgi:peptidoglycan/LPS O-acetylase OafA/YrhL
MSTTRPQAEIITERAVGDFTRPSRSVPPANGGARPRDQRIPSLDGIRVFAFLAVFVAHLGFEKIIPGGFGVTVFFFLSGFLIATLLRMEFDRTGGISIRHFYLRRLLRIAPPFLAALVLASAVTIALGGRLEARMIGLQLAQLTNYAIAFGHESGKPLGSGVVWSLAVEEHFYLIFPIVYLGLRRWVASPRQRAGLLLALCAAALVWRCALVLAMGQAATRTYFTTDTRFDSIVFGCVLAEWGNPVLEETRHGERWWKRFALPVSIAALLATFLIRNPSFRETLRYTIQGVALIPLFSMAIRYTSWSWVRVLNAPGMNRLADLSYSLYLVHYTVILAVGEMLGFHGIANGVIALPVSILIAQGFHLGLERPCASIRRRLSHT